MAEFFAMGGHAVWVWSCYGLSAGGIAFLIWLSFRQRARAREWQKLSGDGQP
ncbi:MAG TPA: heme exporter protein CcmD [Oceanicaulis sp.]|jgi:heme exporter protein CcmD|uniref:heme exporter protein CcmD n=1 Tax=Glycocaulis albus TaxID=1382801 RepID=UPI000EE31168|nr:heme exporter protein CcmD [Glycocaulis albus]MBV5256860.1 heme exporter protein CcmD [Synechococcus moorigangaii CMS01]HCY56502.1 heme exporter protein CcmD [Oceanicaulis sp.]